MPVMTLPNGRQVEVPVLPPEGTPEEEVAAKLISKGLATPDDFRKPTTMEKIGGMAEIGANLISGAIAEPVAGILGSGGAVFGGLYRALGDEQKGNQLIGESAQLVRGAQDAMTYQPRTEAGQQYQQGIGKALAPVGKAINAVTQGSGDFVYDLTGSPAAAALATAAPIALAEAIGGVAGKGASSIARKSAGLEVPSAKTLERKSLIESGTSTDIPVMTSDVFPPKSAAGKFLQDVSDKLGFIGTGGKRSMQQEARQQAVSAFVDELGIELDSPFADDVIRSLNEQNKAKLADASNQRTKAITALDTYGGVETKKAISAIDKEIAAQKELGSTGKQEIINRLEDYKTELLKNPSFSLAAKQRTQLIKDAEAAARGEDIRPSAILSNVKKALDEDMKDFAKANDRQAAANWVSSNKKFFDELDPAKQTEIKRLLDSGTATPEIVIPILKRGRPSELNRLASRLTPAGIVSAQKAIIQDILKESKYFDIDSDPNPTLFINALQKPNRQMAVKAFFKGNDAKAIDSLGKVLQATRQAQSSQALPQTGAIYTAATPLAVVGGGGALLADGGTSATIAATGLATTAAIMKLYESKPFRNMLVKLANQDPKSAAYNKQMGLISAEISGAVAAENQRNREEKPQATPINQEPERAPSNLQGIFPDPNAMLDQAKQVERQERFAQSMQNVERKAADMAASYKVEPSRKLAIDMQSIASQPKYVGMALLNDLYDNDPAQVKIAENFITVAMTKPQYKPTLTAVKNVLRNANVIPPDNKQDDINRMISMGVKPEKAAIIANTIRPLKPQEAKKVAESIRAKLTPDMYNDFAPLISSIEALA